MYTLYMHVHVYVQCTLTKNSTLHVIFDKTLTTCIHVHVYSLSFNVDNKHSLYYCYDMYKHMYIVQYVTDTNYIIISLGDTCTF